MKHLLVFAVAACAFATVGCQHHNLSKGCNDCDSVKHAAVAGDGSGVQLANYNGGGPIADGAIHDHGADCNCGDGGGANLHPHADLSGYGFGGWRNPQAVPVIPPTHNHHAQPFTGPHGPSQAAVGYPYYTTRGPRDFLMSNPPSIGY